MRVVIAPDKFKGSLTAAEVAAAVADGLGRERPDLEVVVRPVADGGDGTVDAVVSVGFQRVLVDAVGPTGRPVSTSYAVSGDRAVVELAAVVGLDLLPGRTPDPLGSSTYGLGVVIAHAIEQGARELVLGVGGSASTDGGAGMVQALGADARDVDGLPLGRGGGALAGVVSLSLGGLRDRIADTRFVVASDVDNPLLGPRGAAAIFAPQKGATPDEVALLERGLQQWSQVVGAVTGSDHVATPGAGAAGGTAYAALALLDAELRPGIELLLDLVGFSAALTGADLVITGEGSLDEQSLAGKAPVGVSAAAAAQGIPVVAVAGRCLLDEARLAAHDIKAAYPLTDLETDVAVSMREAAPLLRRVGARIAAEWLT